MIFLADIGVLTILFDIITTPDERTRDVRKTQKFLTSLASPACTFDVPEAVRQHAERLLHYYPDVAKMDVSHSASLH